MLFRPAQAACAIVAAVALLFYVTKFFDLQASSALHLPTHSGAKEFIAAGRKIFRPSVSDIEPLADPFVVNATVEDGPEVTVTEPEMFDRETSNSTLGFGKIFAIGLPERTDRRDQLRLMSSYQGIQLEWIDGVKGEQMHPKAWPPGVLLGAPDTGKNMTLPEAGCWRAHMDALSKIIDGEIESALIIEDDVDWDVALKSQMRQTAAASRDLDSDTDLGRHNEQSESISENNMPYGSRWDLLWIGHCNNPSIESSSRSRTFTSEYGTLHYLYNVEKELACSFGYAVTLKGARTLFGYLQDARTPIDVAMNGYCRDRECRLVWPTLMFSRSWERDSDIRSFTGSSAEVSDPKVPTDRIKNSAIVDMLVKTHPGKDVASDDASKDDSGTEESSG